MLGYAVFKVFFSNLKRGGILLILIAVGSLYLFGVPRGYMDGFTGWCKQVIGLCLTTFLQSAILIAGLMVLREELLLGLGLMLSAGEFQELPDILGWKPIQGLILWAVFMQPSMPLPLQEQLGR